MSDETKTGARGLEALQKLVGKWHIEGERSEGPLGRAGPFVALETYEWLDGGNFLIHRLDGKVDGQVTASVGIFGKDTDAISVRAFEGDGKVRRFRLTEQGPALVMTLQGAQDEGERHLRYTMWLEEAGDTLVGRWERSRDGEAWTTVQQTRGTRALPLPNTSIGS